MSWIYNNADGTASGTTPSAANTGGANGTAMDINIAGTGATMVFSSAQAANGSQSYALATTTTNSSFFIIRNAGGTANTLTFPGLVMYCQAYFYYTAVPTVGRIMQFTNSSIQLQGGVGLSATAKLTVVNQGGTTVNTSTTTIPANAWFRIEMWMTSSNTAGQIIAKIFLDKNSITPTETITTASNINTRGGNVSAMVVGYPTTASTSATLYLDGIGVSDTNWVMPVDASRTNFLMF